MNINEYFQFVTENLIKHVEKYNFSTNEFGEHFEYAYNKQGYRISLMFGQNICIFKKDIKNDFYSKIVGGRKFNPIINVEIKINDFKEFLTKIELETSFWT
jgi:hypothetical protein